MAGQDQGKDHKNYRDAGVAYSVTISGIVSALIAWTVSSLCKGSSSGNPCDRLPSLFLIISGVLSFFRI